MARWQTLKHQMHRVQAGLLHTQISGPCATTVAHNKVVESVQGRGSRSHIAIRAGPDAGVIWTSYGGGGSAPGDCQMAPKALSSAVQGAEEPCTRTAQQNRTCHRGAAIEHSRQPQRLAGLQGPVTLSLRTAWRRSTPFKAPLPAAYGAATDDMVRDSRSGTNSKDSHIVVPLPSWAQGYHHANHLLCSQLQEAASRGSCRQHLNNNISWRLASHLHSSSDSAPRKTAVQRACRRYKRLPVCT